MGRTLRMLGLTLVAVWIVLLVAGEKFEFEAPQRGIPILVIGIAMMIGGVVLEVINRTGHLVIRPRCVRCGRGVQRGETYCPEHFHDAVNRIRDKTGQY